MKKLLLLSALFSITHFYAQDGTLDSSFGNGGKVTTNVNGLEKAHGVVVQADGKIVIGGYTNNANTGNDFLCIRYNANGTIDTNFGTNGIATFDLQPGADDMAYSIDIDSSGKLYLAGYSDDGTNKNGAVIRLNTDGSLDNSFGTGGKVITDFTATVGNNNPVKQDEFKVVKVHFATGKIIVAGTGFTATNNSVPIMARYNPNGTLDTTFNGDGKKIQLPSPITGWTFHFGIEDIAVKPNGKITAVGWIKPTTGATFYDADHYEVRINSDGTNDDTFDNDGYDSDNLATSDDKTYAVILNPDDSFHFGGGHPWNDGMTRMYIGVTSANGASTTNTTLSFWSNAQPTCYALAKDSNGKFITGGTMLDAATGNKSFLLTRVKPDYSIDNTFGTGGYVMTDFDNTNNDARDMKLQPDGKIILAGFSGNKVAVARYHSGTLTNGEVAANASIKLYPNPASGQITIDLGGEAGPAKYSINDINGRTVANGQFEGSSQINVEDLENGVYFVNVSASGKMTNLKFIKK
ncbi:T9SS type A sorting domain-containing protein [Flavobacterium sp.]|uniref:T9SS type A sorting domain-containing protein n=1 Tax=Flavobacterium sp. TaxID=239 RepID=UPI0040344ADA